MRPEPSLGAQNAEGAPLQSIIPEETDSRQVSVPREVCEPPAAILEEKERRSVGLSRDEMLLGFPG